MLDLNQYYDNNKKLLDEIYYTNQALVRFTYDQDDGCAWIMGNKDKVNELTDKFNEVVLALKGEFTRAYAGSLGTKIIYNHLYSSLEKLENHCESLSNKLDELFHTLLIAKFDSLERETNTVIYDMILTKVKENQVYTDYINDTLKTNHKAISKYLQNSTDPAKDLTLLPSVLISILNDTMTYFTKADMIIGKQHAHHKLILNNPDIDGIESNKLIDHLLYCTNIDITNKVLGNTEVEAIILEKLKQYPNKSETNYTMIDAVENLLNNFNTTFKESLKRAIDKIKDTDCLNKRDTKNFIQYFSLLENLTKNYEQNKITNEEYEKYYEYYNKWINSIDNLEKQYYFILVNTIVIISELINFSIESYNSLSKSFKFME